MTYTPQGHARFVRCACNDSDRAGSDAKASPAIRTARIRQMAVEVLVSGQPRPNWAVRAETAGSVRRHNHQYRPGHPAIGALCGCGAPVEELIARMSE